MNEKNQLNSKWDSTLLKVGSEPLNQGVKKDADVQSELLTLADDSIQPICVKMIIYKWMKLREVLPNHFVWHWSKIQKSLQSQQPQRFGFHQRCMFIDLNS